MSRKLTMYLSLSFCVFALSACGADAVGVTDTQSMQGALEEGAEEALVDAECLAACIDKGESEEDCNLWCSDDKDEASTEDCLAECIDKGESEEDCDFWCSEDKDEEAKTECLEECIAKGETEEDCVEWCSGNKDEWDDKDECDYDDKDEWDEEYDEDDK